MFVKKQIAHIALQKLIDSLPEAVACLFVPDSSSALSYMLADKSSFKDFSNPAPDLHK